ncbi:MAG: hypothetical protein ACOH19_16130 [Rhodoglobus sp.]
MSRALIGVATATILLASLTACSAGADGGGGKLDPAKSPLSTYFDAIYGGTDEDTYAAQQVQVEEMVAACMSDEGFEYIPVDQTQGQTNFSGDEWKPDDEEWVAQYGWGVVNYPGKPDAEEPTENTFVDPNQDYVAGLSESEQAAFYETLYGPQPSEEEIGEDGSYEYNWEDGGCYGAAQHEVQGDNPFDDEKNKPLIESMNKIYENIQTDPRMVEANAKWASCMADAGFDGYANAQEAQNKFYDELNALYEGAPEGLQPDDPKLKELGTREIEIAVADLKCAKEADTRQLALKVQFDLEEQFIAENKAELDALLADAEQSK